MSIFSSILFPIFVMVSAHCIGDYPLQGEFLGTYKSKNNFILLVHCFIYSACIMVGYWVLHINGLLQNLITLDQYTFMFLVLLVSHFFIDKYKCVERDKLEKEYGNMNDPTAHSLDINLFYFDQAMHFVFILVIPAIVMG